jgi:hypothetical protein
MLNNILEIVGWQIGNIENFCRWTAKAKTKY